MNSAPLDPRALRPLGRTRLEVTRLGVGTAPLGDLYEQLGERQATDMLDASWELGLRLYDTSPFYGSGLAEHRTGALLRRMPRSQFVLSTKVGRWYRPPPAGRQADRGSWAGGLEFDAVVDYSYEGAMRSFEQSTLRLGVSRLDVLLIHDVDVHTHGSREACDRRFDEAMEGAYRALDELRKGGDIQAIGVGVNEADMCARFARSGDFDCMLLAGRYTLLDQSALDEFLPLCEQKGIAMLAAGVFNSGVLASGPQVGAKFNYKNAPPPVLDRVAKLDEVCRAHGVPLAAAAIQFPLGHPSVASVIVGAIDRSEIEQDAQLMATPIPRSLWDQLRSEGLLRQDAPIPVEGTGV